MDLAYYNDQLYAGVQTGIGYGGGGGEGQVWRYDGGTAWTQVGLLDNSVMVLEVCNGTLYAATNANKVYSCSACDGSDWTETTTRAINTGFRAGHVSSVCGNPQLFLGELNSDTFWRVDCLANNLEYLENHYGSCIWDFADFSDRLYAGAYAGTGPIFRTVDGLNCDNPPLFEQIHTTGANNWALQAFYGKLYVGGGRNPGSDGGKLWTYDGATWELEKTWPTTVMNEGVSALAADGDTFLYIGLGLPEGYYYAGDGRGEVWRFDGTRYELISESDHFGGGVQSLLLVEGEAVCVTEEACCMDDGSCQNLDPVHCGQAGGQPMGPGTACLGDDPGDGNSIDEVCEQHMIIVVDRTGSMNRHRLNDPRRTRCEDAVIEAKQDLWPYDPEDRLHQRFESVSVWTFAGNAATARTSDEPGCQDFVSHGEAMGSLDDVLEHESCAGWTPLAEAVCDAADHIVACFPHIPKGRKSLMITLLTDGDENNSDGECWGPPSRGAPPPPPCRYDEYSWQQNVCQKVLEEHQLKVSTHFLEDWIRRDEGIDVETGEPRAPGVADDTFFKTLSESSGGTYVAIDDHDPSFPRAGGACCFLDNSCVDPLTQSYCQGVGGEYLGDNTVCLGDNNGNDMDDACEPVCGDNVREGYEECDGTDDSGCPGQCQGNCTCPPGDGACCSDDGTCSYPVPQIVCEADGGEYLGDDTACLGNDGDAIDDACCTVACAPGATPEGEGACHEEYDDAYNGGCDAHPGGPVFGSISCGQTICGTTGNYNHLVHCTQNSDCNEVLPGDTCNIGAGKCNAATENTRDRDVYEITVAEWTTMTFSVESEAVLILAGLVEQGTAGSGNCGDSTGYVDPAMLPSWCTEDWVEVTVPPGTYWWYVAAAADSGSVCGAGSTYNATLTCETILCEADTCAGAYEVGMLPFVRTRSSCGCADDYDEACPWASTSPDAVYKYTPPSDTTVDISLCESGYNTKLYVYENTCPATGPEYACADDTPGCGDGTRSELTNLSLTGGNTYYIVVDGWNGQCGDYELRISSVPPCDWDNGPAEEDCGGASTRKQGAIEPQSGDGCGRASQYASDHPFFAEVADDFAFGSGSGAPCLLDSITFTVGHWNHQSPCVPGGGGGCADTPADYDSIRVTIYDDLAGVPGGQPVYPAPDGSHTGNVAYELVVPLDMYTWVQDDLSTYTVTMDVSHLYVLLEEDTTYWLAIAPEVRFAGFYQTGWIRSSDNTGNSAMQGFPDVAPPVSFWTTTGTDMAFVLTGVRLLPQCGNGVIDPGEECDPGNPGLGIPPDPGECAGRPCIAAGEVDECTCGNCPLMAADMDQPYCEGCFDCSDGGTCGNGQIEGSELAGLACAYLNNCYLDAAGVGRAIYIWRNGESYCWDNAEQDWIPSTVPPISGCCGDPGREKAIGARVHTSAGIGAAGSAAAQILGVGSKRTASTRETKVAITLDAPAGTSAMVLEYRIPKGWKVTAISDGGSWDERHRKVKWGPFFETRSRRVTLTATPLLDTVQMDGSSGTVWFDGVSHLIAAE